MTDVPEKKQQGRSVQDTIRQVLLREWDPIGIKDVPESQDEYDAYIGGIYRLLARGATESQIVEHLDRIESEQMSWSRPDKDELLPVARKLLSLNVRLKQAG